MLGLATLGYLGAIGLMGLSTRGAAEETIINFANETAGLSGFAMAIRMLNLLVLRAFPLIVVTAGLLVIPGTRGGARTQLALLLVAAIVGNLIANNPFASARLWLVTALFGVLAPLVFRRMRTGWMVVAMSIGGLTLLPALHESRFAFSFDEWLVFFRLASPIDYLAQSGDVDSLGMLSLCVRWVDVNGHTLGRQILGALLFFVPRRFWQTKPIGTGALISGGLGFDFTNLSPPIMAEALVDWGYLGVIGLAVVFGLILSRADRSYWVGRPAEAAAAAEPRVIDVLYPFWLACIIFFTRGDLLSAMAHTSAFLVWAPVIGFGARLAPRQQDRSAALPGPQRST